MLCGYKSSDRRRSSACNIAKWDASFGTPGAGGKTKDAASGAVTVACRGVGEVASSLLKKNRRNKILLACAAVTYGLHFVALDQPKMPRRIH
jgi:hypothetical protein